jgi:glycosyltransferase involved in cell wall biosynthesis
LNVSVIIPCHNASLWIVDAIRSVAAQTISPKEIIIVDDASTDNSLEKACSVGIPLEIISVEKHNAAAARNIGISAATGEWVAFLDADDEWFPDHLERASKLLGPTDVAYLATSQRRYAENRSQLFEFPWPAPWPSVPRSGLNRWDFLNWFSAVSAFNNSSLVLSLNVLHSIGGYDLILRRRHDYELFMRMICHGTWTFDPTPAAIVQRNTPGSISRALVECSYFFLLGLQKNYAAYQSPEMDYFLRQKARGALRDALTFGTTKEIIKMWEISRPVLSPSERMVYSLLMLIPNMSRYLYKFKDGIESRMG